MTRFDFELIDWSNHSPAVVQDLDSIDEMVAVSYSMALKPNDAASMDSFLESFARFGKSRSATSYDIDFQSRDMLSSGHFDIDLEVWAEYLDHYYFNDPRFSFINRNPDIKFYYDYQLIDEQEIKKSEYYDWLGRNGYKYFSAFQIKSSPQLQHAISLQRTPEQGHFSPAELRRIFQIGPNIINALAVRAELLKERSKVAGLEALLEDNKIAAVLLGPSGSVMHLTDPARKILNARDGLSIQKGEPRLVGQIRPDDLKRWIADTVDSGSQIQSDGKGKNGSTSAIAVSRPSGLPSYILRAVPQRKIPGIPGRIRPNIAACLVIIDPSQMRLTDRQVIKTAFGLSDADADLCVALCQGISLRQYAIDAKCSYETVRWRLKQIFSCLSISSQTQLVAKVQSLN